MESSKEMVSITKESYDELQEDSKLLNCLRAGGVDNWEGWDDAIDMMDESD